MDTEGAADRRSALTNSGYEITAKLLGFGRLFLFCDRICNDNNVDNQSHEGYCVLSGFLSWERIGIDALL